MELNKSSPLHATVEGFMTGLKALPKGSADRGKFITAHMGHGPFLGALNAHPQGKQVHSMLTNHLNSASNAGFKTGQAQTMAKNDELDEQLDKAVGFKDKAMASQASADAHKAFLNKPMVAKPHKQSLPSPEEHAARASMFADFMPPAGMKKDVNGSYEGVTNVVKGEELALSKNGQWSLTKAASVIPSYTFKDAKSQPAEGKKAGYHEYSVHQGGKHIGHATVHHDGAIGGSVDWDAHPHLQDQLKMHHASMKRTADTTKN